MEQRRLGSTGRDVSVIGLGTWQLGADWGTVTDADARATLTAAVENGVTFLDTADVYGDGVSERRISSFLADLGADGEHLFVATKAGRRLDPHVAEGYTGANIEAFIDRSLANLATERLDLVQMHCPPTPVYSDPSLFEHLEGLVAAGKIANWGVSVETVGEAMTALGHDGLASIQVIFNPFRLKPAEELFAAAQAADVGIIVRVPLASGLLTGKVTAESTFAADDHRNYNRHGEAFDVGETFSGVPLGAGLAAVAELAPHVPEGVTMAQWTLRWILDVPGVTTVIPGARNAEQATANALAAGIDPVTDEARAAIDDVYDRLIRPEVHHRW